MLETLKSSNSPERKLSENSFLLSALFTVTNANLNSDREFTKYAKLCAEYKTFFDENGQLKPGSEEDTNYQQLLKSLISIKDSASDQLLMEGINLGRIPENYLLF